jgi:zinc protease
MHNSEFDPEEVESERTVIISERQGHENEPMFLLAEEVQAAAFRVHSYHHEVIGDQADLETIHRDDLYQHYRSHYFPGNAILTLAGDFSTNAMLDRIRELYEPLPGGSLPKLKIRPEPVQSGERIINVEGPGDTTYVEVVYHAPAASDPDFFPYLVADSLLTGPSSLNVFGGGISNKTSLLYQALVDKELAVSLHGGLTATVDPFLHTIMATVHPESTAEAVVEAIDKEVSILQKTPPRQADVDRAVKQARALFAYGSESITNQAFWMGYAEIFDNYEWFLSYLDRLAEVTPEQIQGIAQKYMRRSNRVRGVYRPFDRQEIPA